MTDESEDMQKFCKEHFGDNCCDECTSDIAIGLCKFRKGVKHGLDESITARPESSSLRSSSVDPNCLNWSVDSSPGV